MKNAQGLLLELIRLEANGSRTKGVLLLDGQEVAKVLELPWRDNRRGLSRIPVGTYKWRKALMASKKVPALAIDGVPDRTAIFIHSGNKATESRGCPMVGERWNGDRLVASLRAKQKLLAACGESGTIVVKNDWGIDPEGDS